MSSTPTLIKLFNYIRDLINSLDMLIQTIRGNMMLSAGWSGVLFLLGIGATIVLYEVQRFQNIPDLVKVGPTLLTSSLTAFQIKPILVNRERIVSYRSLRGRLQNCDGLPQAQVDALIAEAIQALQELRKRD